uniref:Cation/H+ exchanger domain-containing protein n=1 Tax=Kalanchoe fedtschenkoi TaxID=63787 RepID=A0A7N0U8M1_KALFE
MANKTAFVCSAYETANSDGLWFGDNPLRFTTPLLLLQISVFSVTWHLIHFFLKPLGQSSMIAQILGGIVLGPTVFGRMDVVTDHLFPPEGRLMLETLSAFSIMFVFFLIGVKSDVIMMLRPNKRAMTIGFSVFFFTISIPTVVAIIIVRTIHLDSDLSFALPFVTISQAVTAVPVIAVLLMELKIINTELGRLALASTIFCDILGVTAISIIFSAAESKDGSIVSIVSSISSTAALIGFASYVFRPIVLWIANQTPPGKPVRSGYVCFIILSVLASGLLSELIGQHYILGPMIFGLAVPDGPPLGSAIVSKLDTVISEFMYPVFLGCSGLKTNLFSIRIKALLIVTLLLAFVCVVKTAAVVFPALYFNMPRKEAFALGIVMNAKGISELVLYNLWRDVELLGEQEFAMLVISVMATVCIIPPLVRPFYDPMDIYTAIEWNTLQHSKRDSELRVMVCIHSQENVPTIINLLEVSNPTPERPIVVIAMQLVELVGRAMPILMAHGEDPTRALEPDLSKSNHITNALGHYEAHHEGCARVKLFTTVSHYDTMHQDIVQVAAERHVTIVIMPFHKQWAIDGFYESVSRHIQNVNMNVLSKAPCSVGVLVDRGVLTGSLSIINTLANYRVLALFIGCDDDMEALTYGDRMARHERVSFTLFRLILPDTMNSRNARIETDYISSIRRQNSGNERFDYFENQIKDGVSLASAIREIVSEDRFDLILVGKHHPPSAILRGLEEWSECPELGVIGDMLTSQDSGSAASVLVVQQHRVVSDFVGSQPRRVEEQQILPETPPGEDEADRTREHVVSVLDDVR